MSASVSAQPPAVQGGVTPPSAAGARWRQRAVTAVFLGPALVFLVVWIVYPTIRTIIRSFFGETGGDFVGIDNYRELFTSDTLLKAIKNNAIWLAVVPALVTAIGLIFAVLTERIRWSVAFKIAVFMPMAISLFAAGVIWHLMDQKDPSVGTLNAAIKAVDDAVSPSGVLPSARGSTPEITGSTKQGLVLKTTLKPGDQALLGLTAVPPASVPKNAKQAATPPAGANEIVGTVWRDFKPG